MSTSHRDTLRPAIRELVTMIAEAALDEAEREVAETFNFSTQVPESENERSNPDPAFDRQEICP